MHLVMYGFTLLLRVDTSLRPFASSLPFAVSLGSFTSAHPSAASMCRFDWLRRFAVSFRRFVSRRCAWLSFAMRRFDSLLLA